MDLAAFQANCDFTDIVEKFLSGLISHQDLYTQAKASFVNRHFICPDLERTWQNKKSFAHKFLPDYPSDVDEDFLNKWFECFGLLSNSGRFLLEQLSGRKRAFNDRSIKYFLSKGIDYSEALQELFDATLVQLQNNDKLSPPLTPFSRRGIAFKTWQDRVIEFYLTNLITFNLAQKGLVRLLDAVNRGIIIGIKIAASGFIGPPICKKYDKREYTANNFNSIPQIPMTRGCKCLYLPIMM